MSDTDEEDADEPVVQLGDGESVEGAPLARVASRLHYPIEKSEVDRREGETTVRTPEGPRELGDVLAATDEVYFPTDNDLLEAVEDVAGTGPVPTAGEGGVTSADDDGATTDEGADGVDAGADEGDGETADGDENDGTDADEGEFEFDDN